METSQFSCESQWVGGRSAAITVHGDLDMHSAVRLKAEVERLEQAGIADHLLIDLTACTFMDSDGLSALVAAQHVATTPLNVVTARRQILKALTISNLDAVFHVHFKRAEALRELKKVGADSPSAK